MKLSSEVVMKENSVKTVVLYGKVPKPFKHRDMIIKATGFGKRILRDN